MPYGIAAGAVAAVAAAYTFSNMKKEEEKSKNTCTSDLTAVPQWLWPRERKHNFCVHPISRHFPKSDPKPLKGSNHLEDHG
jgi:hypothetical protein